MSTLPQTPAGEALAGAPALNTAEPVTLTLAQVRKACRAHKQYSAADRARKEAEETKKASAMVVFEALLGIKSEDDLRAMSPEQLKRTARRRIRQGLVQLEGMSAEALLDKVIQKSKSERRPSWKDCFIKVLGASAAADIQEATPESFSYKLVESGLDQ
jgi:hypothetical protein